MECSTPPSIRTNGVSVFDPHNDQTCLCVSGLRGKIGASVSGRFAERGPAQKIRTDQAGSFVTVNVFIAASNT